MTVLCGVMLVALLSSENPRVVALRVEGTLDGPGTASLQGALVTATQRALLQRYQVVGGTVVGAQAEVQVRIRGDRAYVKVTGEDVTPVLARIPDEKSRRPTVNAWTGPLREELVMDMADVVSAALLHPKRPALPRAHGTKVDVTLLEADVDSVDEDILALELRTALPTLAGCLDKLKDTHHARDVEVKVAWDAQGRAVGVQLADFDGEPAVQQCFKMDGRALSVPSVNSGGAAVGTLKVRVEPGR